MTEVNLFNPHDGLTGRDGGPYLDAEERRLAEIRRAAIEGREPDFDNAPAVAGTPLVTAGQLVEMANPTSNPSRVGGDPAGAAVELMAKDENFPVSAFSTREKTEDEIAMEEREASASIANNPANPTVTSSDPDSVDSQTREQVSDVSEDSDEVVTEPTTGTTNTEGQDSLFDTGVSDNSTTE